MANYSTGTMVQKLKKLGTFIYIYYKKCYVLK